MIDHIQIMCRGLIVHAPAAVQEFELTIRDELLHIRTRRISLIAPPDLKELLFDIYECTRRIFQQLFDGSVENVFHGGMLDTVVGTWQ